MRLLKLCNCCSTSKFPSWSSLVPTPRRRQQGEESREIHQRTENEIFKPFACVLCLRLLLHIVSLIGGSRIHFTSRLNCVKTWELVEIGCCRTFTRKTFMRFANLYWRWDFPWFSPLCKWLFFMARATPGDFLHGAVSKPNIPSSSPGCVHDLDPNQNLYAGMILMYQIVSYRWNSI